MQDNSQDYGLHPTACSFDCSFSRVYTQYMSLQGGRLGAKKNKIGSPPVIYVLLNVNSVVIVSHVSFLCLHISVFIRLWQPPPETARGRDSCQPEN